jgi:hypothetical protein
MGLGCVWGSCQSREDIWTEKFVDDDSWRTMCYSIRHWKLVDRKCHAVISMDKNCAQGVANVEYYRNRYCTFFKLRPNKQIKSTPQSSS